jgi:hypothetical protein
MIARGGLIHAYLNFASFVLLDGSMEAYFHLIEIDMDELFTVCADFRDLTVKVNGIAATGTARNDNSDDFGFLLHLRISFQIWRKYIILAH